MVKLKAKCEKLIFIAFFGFTAIMTSMEAIEMPLMESNAANTPILLLIFMNL